MNSNPNWFKLSNAVLSTIGTGLFPIGNDRTTYGVMVKAIRNLTLRKGLGGGALDALVSNIQTRVDPAFVSPIHSGGILVLNKNKRDYARSQWYPIPSFEAICARNRKAANAENGPENRSEIESESEYENGHENSIEELAFQRFSRAFSAYLQPVFIPFSYQMTPADAESLASWMLNIIEEKKKYHNGTSPFGFVPMISSSTGAAPVHDVALSGSDSVTSGSLSLPDENGHDQLTCGSPSERRNDATWLIHAATYGVDMPSTYARGEDPRGGEKLGQLWSLTPNPEPGAQAPAKTPLPAPADPAGGGGALTAPETPDEDGPIKLAATIWLKKNKQGRDTASGYLDIGDEKFAVVFTDFDRGFGRIERTGHNAEWCVHHNKNCKALRDFEQATGERRTVSALYDGNDPYAYKNPKMDTMFAYLIWEDGFPASLVLVFGYERQEIKLSKMSKCFKGDVLLTN